MSHANFIEEVDENGLFYLVAGKEIIGGNAILKLLKLLTEDIAEFSLGEIPSGLPPMWHIQHYI